MSFLKKFNIGSLVLLASTLLGVIGFLIFIINSTTGYLAGSQIDVGTLVLTLISLLSLIALVVFRTKLERFNNIILIIIGVMLSVATCLFVYSRVYLAADVWFIPVNYPDAEETALTVSIIGIIFYVLSLVGIAISTILGITHEEKAE